MELMDASRVPNIRKAYTIAKHLGGGVRDFLWLLDEASQEQLEFVFLVVNRGLVSESLGSIPSDEAPTKDELDGYQQRTLGVEDLAWSEHFEELCQWLADYQAKQRKNSAKKNPPGGGGGLAQFDFSRE